MLSGMKTYIIAAAMVAYQVIGYLLGGAVPDINMVLEGLGLAALRAGIAKG